MAQTEADQDQAESREQPLKALFGLEMELQYRSTR